jgi:flagellar protein FliO/FliZ
MEYTAYINAILALILVLGLIGLCSFLFKKVTQGQFLQKSAKSKRLKVEEVLYIDTKRKLVLIKRDDVEHLVLLGVNSETVIERDVNLKNVIT